MYDKNCLFTVCGRNGDKALDEDSQRWPISRAHTSSQAKVVFISNEGRVGF